MSFYFATILAITWGPVSEWCMLLVASITAFYLYKTLQSQKEVQRTQTKLFEIESVRFRESIKPKFAYKISKELFKTENPNSNILTLEITNETDSIAFEISLQHTGSEDLKQVFIPMGFDSIRTHLTKTDSPILYHFLLSTERLSFLTFSLTYKDLAGTNYRQNVICVIDSRGKEIHPSLPEIINKI